MYKKKKRPARPGPPTLFFPRSTIPYHGCATVDATSGYVRLLVGAAEGWCGWRGHAYPCAVLCYVVICNGVGVGAGVICISGCRFIAFLARCVSKDIKMCGLFGIGDCGFCVGVHLG